MLLAIKILVLYKKFKLDYINKNKKSKLANV